MVISMGYFSFFIVFLTVLACSSLKKMDEVKEQVFKSNGEYEKLVDVKKSDRSLEKLEDKGLSDLTVNKLKKKQTKELDPISLKIKTKAQRLPELEDHEGFHGRRPLVDPFVVGEKTIFDVTYFNLAAGHMTIEVKPFVNVNGKKAYHFVVGLKSSKVFSYFYSVDDVAETYMDYEKMLPYALSIHVRESQQFKEIRSFFDWNKLKGTYWERKIKKGGKEKKKKKEWDIKSFSQNVISAIYYVRAFQLEPKKNLAFRVADDGKNIVFKGQVLRREKLKTEIGTLDTIVLKPKFEIDGIFKPTGNIFIWLTDDHRKRIVRIESKIKIGRLIAKVKSIQ